jgi:hypothetical protein
MLYGRLIRIDDTYYNKVIDIDAFSFFVAINKTENAFIKIRTANLDKKNYNYIDKIVIAKSNLLTNLVSLDELLLYSPFVGKAKSLKVNYYKQRHANKKKCVIIHEPKTINFD